MKRPLLAFALVTLFLVSACSKESQTTATTSDSTAPASSAAGSQLTPEQLGQLGAQIKKNPKDAERLLSEHGLNDQTFEQAIRTVSSDPAASKRYAEAYKSAS